MPPIPFLTPEKQIEFLIEHQMIDNENLNKDETIKWLTSINFHSLMGYARNYRALVGRGIVDGPKSFDKIKSIIDSEVELSSFMMPWLRIAEWNLRALTVKHFCAKQEHGEGYLNLDHWTSHREGDREILQYKILDSIQRHPEPYVVNHIDERLKNRPEFSHATLPAWKDLVQDLPLWAAIDSFSIGTLGKFIMLCGKQPSSEEFVWKLIAHDLGINAGHLDQELDAFAVTRNLIFHHQRLWMRPMPKSPGISNRLKRKFKNYKFTGKNKQAHFIALAAISNFLPTDMRETYLEELKQTVTSNELFKIGIMESPFTQ